MNVRKLYDDFSSEYFNPGPVYISRGISFLVGTNYDYAHSIVECVMRYCQKDWGELEEADSRLNEESIARNDGNLSLFAVYEIEGLAKIYISTHRYNEMPGEYMTTVYLPEEH